jgi:hypothetical protein
LTYAQAAELTLCQLLHALGVDPRASSEGEIAMMRSAAQREMLDRIARRRQCLPMELARIPTGDLIEQIKAETDGKGPAKEMLAGILGKYLASAE